MSTETQVDLGHILCGECPNEPEAYVCGTPRQPDEVILDMADPHITDDCAVCFAESTMVCNGCGATIIVKREE